MSRTKSEIEVKVKRIGGLVYTVALNGVRTVAKALEIAQMSPKDTETIKVNGKNATLTHELKDKDIVSLVKNVSGGQN